MFQDIDDQVTKKAKKCMDYLSDACFMEKEAIDLIEKEIELWQE